jgi:putative endonuclease
VFRPKVMKVEIPTDVKTMPKSTDSAATDSIQSKPRSSILGQSGEMLVTQWLQQQGWSILARSWTSRWGELDVVALRESNGPVSQTENRVAFRKEDRMVAFVEVKTRSSGNWDADGLLAITLSKQAKLWKTAQLFLAQHPHLAEYPCRFDVALVSAMRSREALASDTWPTIALEQPIHWNGYRLTLGTYLESAFGLG